LKERTSLDNGLIGALAEFISSALVGSKIPTPQAKAQAPVGFRGVQSPRDMTLSASRQAGYVVPPSTTNPTMTNKVIESIGGKVGTAQDAAIRNTKVTNSLAKKALGITDESITPDALNAIRVKAGEAYESVKRAGEISADDAFRSALEGVSEKYRGAAKDFPELARQDIQTIVDSINKPKFSSDSAIDAISILRDKADAAFGSGDKALGKAYKSISKAIEDVIERNLSNKGESGAELLKKFREARALIAKTYSVEKALNPSTGNVNAIKLAQQLARGKPISGELRTAAKFGGAFPKVSKEILDSGSVRNTDVILGAGSAALSKEPMYLLYPYLRQLARSGLLSDAGQNMTIPSNTNMNPSIFMGAYPQLSNLLGK
jgi:hypothetical protein